MWPTIDGMRKLEGAEAGLVRDAIAAMVRRLRSEIADDAEPHSYGIDWFDQWDVEQRAWLLEEMSVSLLTTGSPPSPAAIWDATIDTIFCEVIESIEDEIDAGVNTAEESSWRGRVSDAFRCQSGRDPKLAVAETDIDRWRAVVTQLADAILGVTCYQQAESFRDLEFERSRRFLIEKGMPSDYLERMPPVRTVAQAEQSIERIGAIVDRS